MESNQNNSPVKQNYYTTKKRKVVDFLLGFLGITLFHFLWYWWMEDRADKIDSEMIFWNMLSLSAPSTIEWVFSFCLVLFGILRKRKFIIFGAAFVFLIPLLLSALLIGACMMSGNNGYLN